MMRNGLFHKKMPCFFMLLLLLGLSSSVFSFRTDGGGKTPQRTIALSPKHGLPITASTKKTTPLAYVSIPGGLVMEAVSDRQISNANDLGGCPSCGHEECVCFIPQSFEKLQSSKFVSKSSTFGCPSCGHEDCVCFTPKSFLSQPAK